MGYFAQTQIKNDSIDTFLIEDIEIKPPTGCTVEMFIPKQQPINSFLFLPDKQENDFHFPSQYGKICTLRPQVYLLFIIH